MMNQISSSEELPLLDKDHKKGWNFKKIRTEIFLLIKIAIPIIVTNLCTFLLLTESIIMTGQLTTDELDACTLANSVINVLGLAVGTGLCTACDTFFSQLYGSKYRKSIGIILIRCIMIISLFPVVLIALHINIEPIFILMKQHTHVSAKAARYMILFSPGLIFGFNFLILTRYMQNQNLVLPPMIIGIVVNIINVISQYLTVHYFKLGFDASPICQAISFFLFWLIQLMYIILTKFYEDTWTEWSRESFLEWVAFLKLAIPGAAMVVMECFCFEIGTILSGIMGKTELAAQSVVFQLETITFMISFGVGIAVNIRVGHFLGSDKPKKALSAYRCGMVVMFISFCITSLIILGFKNYIPVLFTNDKEAQKLSSDLFFIVVGVQFFDAFGTVTMGALRGCGRQKICVLLIFCSYYVLGQPIGISLAFAVGMKVQGLWIGLLVSLAICVPIAVFYTNFIQDWENQAKLCQKRIKDASYLQETEEIKNESLEKLETLSNLNETFNLSHRRSLSKSFSAKYIGDLVLTKYVKVDEKTYRSAYIQKTILIIFLLCILVGGVMVQVYLPKSLYWPKNVTIN